MIHNPSRDPRIQIASSKASGRYARHREAFTLVELLVVIGIIAVLVSLLLPALGRVRFQANELKCLSNIRQIALAVQAYAADNRGFLPRFQASNGGGVQNVPNQTYTNTPAGSVPVGKSVGDPAKWPGDWTFLIFKYTGRTTSVYTCPLRQWKTLRNDSFVADNGVRYDRPLVSYRVNGATLANADAGVLSFTPTNASNFAADVSRPFGPVYRNINGQLVDTEETLNIGRIAPDTILATECVRRNAGTGATASIGELSATVFTNGPSVGITSISTSSHNFKSASFAFFDGHAETIRTATLLRQRVSRTSSALAYSVISIDFFSNSSPNQGNPGDLKLDFFNSAGNPHRGPWTATKGD